MKIGPVDIRNHAFSRKKMRGYDEAEVVAFLELVADRLEEVLVEAEDLRGVIHRLETELGNYRDLDRTLRDSLLSAERLSDGRLDQAEREARIILKNAEVEGEKKIAAARAEADVIRSSLDDLRAQRLTYVERFRALLRSQMKILEASIQSYAPDLADVEETLDRMEAAFASQSRRSAPSAPTPPAAPIAPIAPVSPPVAPASPPVAGPGPLPGLAPTPGFGPDAPLSRTPPPPSYLGEEGLFSPRGTDPAPRIEDD
jgi:cell division initiation protein